MKYILLSLTFLFLVGCGKEPSSRVDKNSPTAEPHTVYENIISIHLKITYKYYDHKNRRDFSVEKFYCLDQSNKVDFTHGYSTDSKLKKLTVFVYADKEKKTLLHKIKGETPNKKYNSDYIDLVFRIPVNKEEYMYIEMQDEKGEVLRTDIYERLEVKERVLLDNSQCFPRLLIIQT